MDGPQKIQVVDKTVIRAETMPGVTNEVSAQSLNAKHQLGNTIHLSKL